MAFTYTSVLLTTLENKGATAAAATSTTVGVAVLDPPPIDWNHISDTVDIQSVLFRRIFIKTMRNFFAMDAITV